MRRLAALAALGLAGCGLPVQGEVDEVSRLARFATRYDHPIGPGDSAVDRVLAGCGEKTAAAETACLREAVAAAPSPAAAAAMVPGCRAGRLCRYDTTTRDRLGFVDAQATDYTKRWRVELDLRRAPAAGTPVPASVADRDDFGAARPGR